jgi:2'-5' RNA ligase
VARLFSALVPPASVLDHLAARPADGPVHWIPRERWHITLGFFGDDDDPDQRARWLRRRVEGQPAPTLRLAGAGTFQHVLWVGVVADGAGFAALAQAAGADSSQYRPHLTLARWNRTAPDDDALIDLFAGYTGPWFTPTEVLLMRSELGAYTTVDRLPLASG